MMTAVMVTGAGTGIGRASAVRLSREGHAVLLVGRRREPLIETLSLLDGEGHKVMAVDVADRQAMHAALSDALGEPGSGPLHLVGVFANAGIVGANAYDVVGESDCWEEILRVNVSGVYVAMQ